MVTPTTGQAFHDGVKMGERRENDLGKRWQADL